MFAFSRLVLPVLALGAALAGCSSWQAEPPRPDLAIDEGPTQPESRRGGVDAEESVGRLTRFDLRVRTEGFPASSPGVDARVTGTVSFHVTQMRPEKAGPADPEQAARDRLRLGLAATSSARCP